MFANISSRSFRAIFLSDLTCFVAFTDHESTETMNGPTEDDKELKMTFLVPLDPKCGQNDFSLDLIIDERL